MGKKLKDKEQKLIDSIRRKIGKDLNELTEGIRKGVPILFGLIRGSDKLYFIGDWIDDICDLTFDELIEVLGEDGIDETRLNVNMYGDIEDVPCSEDNI